MLTEQDFENAEEAIKTIDRHYEENRITNGLRRAEKTLYEFTKKVITEARRDFLTEKNPTTTLEKLRAEVKNQQDYGQKFRNKAVVCAAIKFSDGHIILGIRHFSPDMVLSAALQGYDIKKHTEQGFVDQYGAFLTREEALKIISPLGRKTRLYSEDLY